jgi:homoprotocatechuate degradation regulator HpaR
MPTSSNGTRPARRNLPLLLLQSRERLLARFRPVLNTHGITEQQYRVLRAIESAGPLEPRQIGTICHISSPSLTGVLARMEAMDLVARERLAHDQRRVMVSLTPASRAMFRQMKPRIEAVYQTLEADLGPELSDEIYSTLDRFLARLAPAEAQAFE